MHSGVAIATKPNHKACDNKEIKGQEMRPPDTKIMCSVSYFAP